MPVSVAGGVRKAVGGYLRYMQFRDQSPQPEREGGLDAFVRYVAHRDRSSPGGRIFGADGSLTSADRHRLVDYVARSTKGLEPKWFKTRDGKLEDRQRAVYQLVISPDDWRGLDLRRITRAAMKQLEVDVGPGGIGPWFAAEHRNTAHHHVQIVLAARREIEPGRFSTLIINRARLQRMKEAIWAEIELQRAPERERADAKRAQTITSPTQQPRFDQHAVAMGERACGEGSVSLARAEVFKGPSRNRRQLVPLASGGATVPPAAGARARPRPDSGGSRGLGAVSVLIALLADLLVRAITGVISYAIGGWSAPRPQSHGSSR